MHRQAGPSYGGGGAHALPTDRERARHRDHHRIQFNSIPIQFNSYVACVTMTHHSKHVLRHLTQQPRTIHTTHTRHHRRKHGTGCAIDGGDARCGTCGARKQREPSVAAARDGVTRPSRRLLTRSQPWAPPALLPLHVRGGGGGPDVTASTDVTALQAAHRPSCHAAVAVGRCWAVGRCCLF